MKSTTLRFPFSLQLLALSMLLLAAGALFAQTPVDEDGKPLGPVYSDSDDAALESGDASLLSASQLEALVAQIALYPDDLLAIMLPASTYPLQVVQAARYLEQYEVDSSLQPDDTWDDSVVALLNYPEALQMMSDDIDWTWQLGEAFIAQQSEVVAAVESFRDRAYAAGNLKSDERQTVTRNTEDVIVIDPIEDDVIYVPYYEPERVVVYQPRPVYHYYPRAYPVYYYPYPVGYRFSSGHFWGVTTAFRMGWSNNHLHVFHHSYRGHPYYGWTYYGNYWRRPTVQLFNTWYGSWGYNNNRDHYRYGSYWRPRQRGGARPGTHPGRDRYYSNRRRSYSEDGYADRDRRNDRRRRSIGNDASAVIGNDSRNNARTANRRNPPQPRADVRFRSRGAAADNARRPTVGRQEAEGTRYNRSGRQRPDESAEGRSNPRQPVTRRNNVTADARNTRVANRVQFARREAEPRTPAAAGRPATNPRRTQDAAPRRAAPSATPRRQVQPRVRQAPAPRVRAEAPRRAAPPQKRTKSAPPPQNRTKSAPPPKRSTQSSSRSRSGTGERKAAARNRSQGSARSGGDRRRRD